MGHAEDVNIFATGHHSWSCYPTEVGHTHPHLNFDLLGRQIEACHEMGIDCPIHFTIGWSDNDAWNHSERCVVLAY